MKKVISFLLAICILGQTVVPTLWLVDYQLRRAVYVKHCVNKRKPSLHCDGKCYLRKRMAASTGNDPKSTRLPEYFQVVKDQTLFCEAMPALGLPGAALRRPCSLPPYRRCCPNVPVSAVFKPPAVRLSRECLA